MKTEPGMAMSIGLLALVAVSMAAAQSPAAPVAQVLVSSGGLASVQSPAQEEIVREIDDPHTGDRWLLMRNSQFPGGPGRLVLAAAHRNAAGASGRTAGEPGEAQLIPVIHAGDRLIVEEHTAVVDAVLEARALNPAVAGAQLEVRLVIGGNVVRVVALGPGRAALETETGKRP
jgi:hypothetical protein